MGDNLHIRRPLDASRVNIHETWEVAYWCKEFSCTDTALKRAVSIVGTSAAAVRKYLGK